MGGGVPAPRPRPEEPPPQLTQTRTEKKVKVMAALALLLPRRSPSGCECCHWLARKQKPTNQMPVHRTGGAAREKRGGGAGGSWPRKGGRVREAWGAAGQPAPGATAGHTWQVACQSLKTGFKHAAPLLHRPHLECLVAACGR